MCNGTMVDEDGLAWYFGGARISATDGGWRMVQHVVLQGQEEFPAWINLPPWDYDREEYEW